MHEEPSVASGSPAESVAAAAARKLTALDEWQAKELLAAYGIPVPEGGLAHDEDEAVALARRLDGPVAVKAVGSHIGHKTDRGLVALNLLGDEAVGSAARGLLARTAGQGTRLLVERMVRGKREFMLGMKRDPLFGPVILFGVGGIFAEAHKDVAFGVKPLEERDVEGMLSGIRASSLLGGFRGMPPVDREALVAGIRALERIAVDHPAVVEIDVNPLIIEGATPVAADALVVLDPSAAQHPPTHRTYAAPAIADEALLVDGPGGPCRGMFNAEETSFLMRVTELMERTGKPIINVPLRPLETATFHGSGRYDAVIVYSPVAAIRALSALAWYREYVDARAG